MFADESRFGLVTVSPAFELDGRGRDIDSIAFWEAPNAADSLLFVTAKGNSLVEVWRFPFKNNESAPLTRSTFKGAKVNGVLVDQDADLLYVAVASPSSTISVFTLPDLRPAKDIRVPGNSLKSEPSLALIERADGKRRLYVSAKDAVYILDSGSGKYLKEFMSPRDIESLVADTFHQTIYIPDEYGRSGVYAYDPHGKPIKRKGRRRFGDDVFEADAEGIVVYAHKVEGRDTGKGLIVVADQRQNATELEFFDRKSWAHRGTLRVRGVSNTDGLASTQQVLPGFPRGLLAAVNADRTVVGVGWHTIFEAIGLDG